MSGETYLAELDQQYGLPPGWLEGIQLGESSGGNNLGGNGAFGLTHGWLTDFGGGAPYGAYPVGTSQWEAQANAVGAYFQSNGANDASLAAYTGFTAPPNAAYASLYGGTGSLSQDFSSADQTAADAANQDFSSVAGNGSGSGGLLGGLLGGGSSGPSGTSGATNWLFALFDALASLAGRWLFVTIGLIALIIAGLILAWSGGKDLIKEGAKT